MREIMLRHSFPHAFEGTLLPEPLVKRGLCVPLDFIVDVVGR